MYINTVTSDHKNRYSEHFLPRLTSEMDAYESDNGEGGMTCVCHNVLQCVALCCSVLQCVAECAAVCCNDSCMPQCVAVCCSVLQRVAVCSSVLRSVLQCVAMCCNVL